jgi:xanthine dehydrogenase accessory factor
MLVTKDLTVGTIGGGHLELEAIRVARGFLQKAEIPAVAAASPKPGFVQHFSLGPSLGQCCGGAVDLQFEALHEDLLIDWPTDTLRFTLALFGAGHVGRAIAQALALLPCRLIWIDEREQEFPSLSQGKDRIEIRCVDSPSAEIKTLPQGCFVIITTHSHDLDLELCEAALRRPDLGFIGLIGSHTKKSRFLKRLAQKKITQLERLVCPIGLSMIEGKEPQVIAASVAAQLLSLS